MYLVLALTMLSEDGNIGVEWLTENYIRLLAVESKPEDLGVSVLVFLCQGIGNAMNYGAFRA